MKKYVVVVAGGSGSRMKSDLPKQFIELSGLPVLMHTLNNFSEAINDAELILVLPEQHFSTWKSLCAQYNFKTPVKLVIGGYTRFQSVKNGLKSIGTLIGLVAIHDGVRPFVSESLINRLFEAAKEHGNAIPTVPLNDSIRIIEGETNRALERSNCRLIQTPQCFKIELIQKAFEQEESPLFTDEASVLENMGEKIILLEGDPKNIKITQPQDLLLAERLLAEKSHI